MTILIVSSALVLGISAFCSLFEAVLYAVPMSHVEKLAASGRRSGRVLKGLRQQVDRPIAAILSLNTIANTGGAAIAGAAAGALFGPDHLVWFTLCFTLAVLLFSEVLPKTAGVTYARPLAAAVAWPLQILVWLFSPIVWLCQALTGLITRGQDPQQAISDDELILLTRLGLKAGSIDRDEAAVIQNILELEDRPAAEIMTPLDRVLMLDADTAVKDLQVDRIELRHSHVPVFDSEKDDIIGVVRRRDLLAAAGSGEEGKVEDLAYPVFFAAENMPLDRILRLFLERREKLFVLLNEGRKVNGIITLEDVLENLLGKEIIDQRAQRGDLRSEARRRRKFALDTAMNAEES